MSHLVSGSGSSIATLIFFTSFPLRSNLVSKYTKQTSFAANPTIGYFSEFGHLQSKRPLIKSLVSIGLKTF